MRWQQGLAQVLGCFRFCQLCPFTAEMARKTSAGSAAPSSSGECLGGGDHEELVSTVRMGQQLGTIHVEYGDDTYMCEVDFNSKHGLETLRAEMGRKTGDPPHSLVLLFNSTMYLHGSFPSSLKNGDKMRCLQDVSALKKFPKEGQ